MAATKPRGDQIRSETVAATEIKDGEVFGSTANNGTQREIAQGTISTPDLRNDAVTALKLDATDIFNMSVLRVGDGSVSIPGLSFTSDTDTGIFIPSASNLGITVGSASRLEISVSRIAGFVQFRGITGGTSTPSYSFVNDTNTGIYNAAVDAIGFVTNSTERMRLNSTGLELFVSGSATTPSIFYDGDENTGIFRGGIDILALTTGGTEALRIDASQNVGLGGSTVVDAILSLNTTTKAFLLPRLTTIQRDAITTPAAGMLVYNTTTSVLNFYSSSWSEIAATESDPFSLHINGDNSPTANISWNFKEIQSIVIHKLANDPGVPVEGQQWYNTTDKQMKMYNGTDVVILG